MTIELRAMVDDLQGRNRRLRAALEVIASETRTTGPRIDPELGLITRGIDRMVVLGALEAVGIDARNEVERR